MTKIRRLASAGGLSGNRLPYRSLDTGLRLASGVRSDNQGCQSDNRG